MEEMTITELQEKMNTGVYSARQVTEMYLERIENLDKRGPAVNAILELNPEALIIADSLDRERRARGVRGPLHGIPVLLKDNIDTADQMMTTAGSLALSGRAASKDAFIVSKLREAGAIILGKTNLSEWANFRSTHSTSGWSSRCGQTRNPYALDRNPRGSSSGSAVAVAANFCSAAIGTETDGSVICPASANSIVGIKPTVGLISRSGIIPIAHSQDTAGTMARTVADAAILLGALTGPDPADPATQGFSGKSLTNYTQFLKPNGMQGVRIGVARNLLAPSDKVDAIVNNAIEVMKHLGTEIIDPVNIATAGKIRDSELEVLLYEFKTDLNKYLERLGPDVVVHSIKELIEFNEQNRERILPYFGQEILLSAQEKGPLTDKGYQEALKEVKRLSRTDGIDATMHEHQLDAIMAPSGGPPWVTDLVNGDHRTGHSARPAAVAGYPSITVPAGYTFGLPIGISFIAAAYQEAMLIRLAFAFEQATKVRRPPQFRATADLTTGSRISITPAPASGQKPVDAGETNYRTNE